MNRLKRHYHTKGKIEEHELTDKEVLELARMGDTEAKLELLKKDLQATPSMPHRLEVIVKFLLSQY